MNFDRARRWLMLAVVIGSIAAYCAAEGDAPLFILALAGVGFAWLLTEGRRPVRIARPIINGLVMLAIAYALLRALGEEGFVVSVFSQFVILLLVIKLLDRNTARDHMQVLALSTFLAVGAILTSNLLAVGAILIVLLPILIAAILFHQVDGARERATRIDPATMQRGLAAGRRTPRDVRRLVAFATAVGMTISVAIFIAMPRGLGTSAFGHWGNVSVGQVTGFTDEVHLGTGGLISQATTPVLDLEVTDRNGRGLGAPGRVFYLRGAVLDEYQDGTWRRADTPDSRFETRELRGSQQTFAAVGGEPRRANLVQRVTIRNASQRTTHLFSVWRPSRVQFGQDARLAYSPRDGVLLREGQPGKFEYTVHSVEQPMGEPVLERSEVTPFPSERLATLAAEILREAGIEPAPDERDIDTDALAARSIERYLRANFSYTLDTLAAPPGVDSTEWFVFDGRIGHCEYFASAMAAMCRLVGVPARVVTGYVATEFNENTGHYVVRASNAHAWVEVETSPGVWRTFDPTPPADFRRIHEPSMSVAARIGRWIDSIEYAWINAVVGFNADRRSSIFGTLGIAERLDGVAERFARPLELGGWRVVLRALANGLIAFIVSLMLGLVVLRFRRQILDAIRTTLAVAAILIGRLTGGRIASSIPELTLHRQLLDAMARLGHPKPAWRPLLAHAASMRETRADPAADAAVRAAVLIYHARYSGRGAEQARLAELRGAVEEVRAAARR